MTKVKIGMFISAMALVSSPLFASADVLNRQLEVGSRGEDVSSLQTFLATDATLYPEGLVTGYFGLLTKYECQHCNWQYRSERCLDN